MVLTCSVTPEFMPMISSLRYTFLGGWAETPSLEGAAAAATPLEVWWAPPGKTTYLILQGAEDQIALPENGVELQKELGMRATLVNVPGAAHLLPLEQPTITASHMITFMRDLGRP